MAQLATPSCPLLSTATFTAANVAADASSNSVPGSILAQYVGGNLIGVILLVTFVGVFVRIHGTEKTARVIDHWTKKAKPLIKCIDVYSQKHPVEEESTSIKRSTVVGGTLTILAVASIGVLAAILAEMRSENNVLVVKTLDVISTTTVIQTRMWPWKSANIKGMAAPTTGVSVRITASGEPGKCAAPLATPAAAGLEAGSWEFISKTASCGDNAGTSQFTLGCRDCIFSQTSALSFSMHYSCQSMILEVRGRRI